MILMEGYNCIGNFGVKGLGECATYSEVSTRCTSTATCARKRSRSFKVPLMQIVPIRSDHGDNACEHYDPPIHSSASQQHIGL